MTNRVLWITGGGSGMGQATARSAAAAGWTVVVSGRRAEVLTETVAQIGAAGGIARALPLDVQDQVAVAAARDSIVAEFGRIDALVLAAGRNTPTRMWNNQSIDEFRDIIDTNLTSVATVIDATLADLRKSGGVVVVVSSFAGWAFQPGAGVAYSASKTALGSMARALNQQEAPFGVRACHLCPGDVATDFIQQRPLVPDDAARAVMLTADDIARSVQFVIDAPAHVRIDELVISPISQR
ncbi:MAG: SDR family oxidoreductase [Rhodoglobus sp.]